MTRFPLQVATLLLTAVVRLRAQSHQLVPVGDHQLDVVRAGAGAPAIIFETGLADSLDTWLPVLRSMAEYTSVVAYSRAGFGRSTSGSSDHSVQSEAADLHALVRQLHLQVPLVLVDGTHEQQVRRFGTLDANYPRQFQRAFDSVLARLQPGAQAAETRETVKIQREGTVPGLQPLPDIPIAVITSMKSDESSPYVNGTARGHEIWRALHDEWFRRSRNGIHIATDRSGHGIQDDEPELVSMAIRFILDRVRSQ